MKVQNVGDLEITLKGAGLTIKIGPGETEHVPSEFKTTHQVFAAWMRNGTLIVLEDEAPILKKDKESAAIRKMHDLASTKMKATKDADAVVMNPIEEELPPVEDPGKTRAVRWDDTATAVLPPPDKRDIPGPTKGDPVKATAIVDKESLSKNVVMSVEQVEEALGMKASKEVTVVEKLADMKHWKQKIDFIEKEVNNAADLKAIIANSDGKVADCAKSKLDIIGAGEDSAE